MFPTWIFFRAWGYLLCCFKTHVLLQCLRKNNTTKHRYVLDGPPRGPKIFQPVTTKDDITSTFSRESQPKPVFATIASWMKGRFKVCLIPKPKPIQNPAVCKSHPLIHKDFWIFCCTYSHEIHCLDGIFTIKFTTKKQQKSCKIHIPIPMESYRVIKIM